MGKETLGDASNKGSDSEPEDEFDMEVANRQATFTTRPSLKEVKPKTPEPEPKEKEPEILTKEQANEVMGTESFQDFFAKASRLVTRGLYSDIDVVGSFERMEDNEESHIISRGDKLIE